MTRRSLALTLVAVLFAPSLAIAAESALGPDAQHLHGELQRLDQVLQRRLEQASHRMADGTFEAASLKQDAEHYGDLLDHLEAEVNRLGSAENNRLGDQEAATLQRKLELYRLRVRDLEIAADLGKCPPAHRSADNPIDATRIASHGRSDIAGRGPTPPPNDACEDAIVIGTLGTFTGDTSQATNDGEASCGSSLFGPDVWFKVEVTESGPVFIDTLGSAFDTVLSIHTSCPGTVANEQSCNDDIFGSDSAVGFFGNPGTERWIRVAGFGNEAGAYTLNVGAGGSLSGTVTDAASGPLANVSVTLVNGDGFSVGTQTTDAAGNYTFDDLSPGGFYAFTSNSQGYINEIYDDVACAPNCDPTLGELVLVQNEITTTGIDFALEIGGSLSGTATAASTDGGIDNLRIELWDATGEFVDAELTDAAGEYTFDRLLTGSYFVSTDTSQFLDELYDDLPCQGGVPSGCDATTGTPVAVTLGGLTSGIDFELDRRGSIAGMVTDTLTGDPLSSARIEVYNTSGSFVGSDFTDSAGGYEVSGLVAGSYFVGTDTFFDALDELYDDIPCPGGVPFGCTVTSGTPIVVALNTTTSGIDFVLDTLGGIAGAITDVATADPIASVRVELWNSSGFFVRSTQSDASGVYSFDGLATDNYFVLTEGSQVVNELYDDLPCPDGSSSCDPTTGTAVAVNVNAITSGIDFALARRGAIAGNLSREGSGDPFVFRRVQVWDAGGSFIRSTDTDGVGDYVIDGLDTGTYFVSTDVSAEGVLDELYDDIPCFRGVPGGCDATTGSAVAVVLGATTAGIDFALGAGGEITGTVTDATTGDPVIFADVRIFDASGATIAFENSDSAGVFTVRGLGTGTYFARAEDYSRYARELYDNLPCGGSCNPTTGTPILVAAGSTTSGIDFALDPLGAISGTVSAATGALEGSGFIDLFNSSGSYVDSAFFSTSGEYTIDGLEAGTYFARTDLFSRSYLEQLYDGLPCTSGCNPTTGTPILVSLGSTTTGIDFSLERAGALSGVVLSSAGAPAPDVRIRIWDASGNLRGSTFSNAVGLYTFGGLQAGNYFASTSSSLWLDELFNGQPCEDGCDPTTGTPIRVSLNATTRHIDFSLDQGGVLTGSVTRASNGAPITSERVELWDASGQQVGSDFTDGAGLYVFTDLSPGTYFVSTDAGFGFFDELYDDLPCPNGAPGGCDPTTGTPVAVAVNTTVAGVDFALNGLGTISGIVTDASTGAPISSVRVELWDTESRFLRSDSTNSQGFYEFTSLQPGTYFATTVNFRGYLDELYDNLPCFNGAPAGCEPDKGTPIPVAIDATVTGIDFDLILTSTALTGTVTDATTGEPLAGVLVDIWTTAGSRVTTAITSAAGTYFVGLPADTYFASTDAGSGLLIDEIYEDIACPAPAFGGLCDPTSGTHIEVMSSGTAGDPGVTSGIDFSLGSSVLFNDGFESGDASAWSTVVGGGR